MDGVAVHALHAWGGCMRCMHLQLLELVGQLHVCKLLRLELVEQPRVLPRCKDATEMSTWAQASEETGMASRWDLRRWAPLPESAERPQAFGCRLTRRQWPAVAAPRHRL